MVGPLRKKGGQPGNRSAVTHGRYSAETRAKRIAEAAKRRTAPDEWLAKIPTWDWHATCAAIKAYDRGKPRADKAEVI